MKKYIFLFLFLTNILYGEPFLNKIYYFFAFASGDKKIEFEDDLLIITDSYETVEGVLETEKKYSYNYTNTYGIYHLNGKEKQSGNIIDWTFIASEEILIILGQERKTVYTTFSIDRDKPGDAFYKHGDYYFSSLLTEGNMEYNMEDDYNRSFMFSETLKPWAEGKRGSGIGEYIQIDNQDQRYKKIRTKRIILLINGFVSFEKPYLFEENNRIKKLEMLIINSDGQLIETRMINFKNSAEPKIELVDYAGTLSYKFTIKEVYYGSKYNDTCLTYLGFAYQILRE